jgi:hypothetical protein
MFARKNVIRLLIAGALLLWPAAAFAQSTTTTTSSVTTNTACDQFSGVLGFHGPVSGQSNPLAGEASLSTGPTGLNGNQNVFGPTIAGSLPGDGSSETFCLPNVVSGSDLFATLDFTTSPNTLAYLNTINRNGRNFGVQVTRADNGQFVTNWDPTQCTLGHALFTLGTSSAPNTYNGPFLLRFFNFSNSNISYTMTVSGPGARNVPGADVTLTPNYTCHS